MTSRRSSSPNTAVVGLQWGDEGKGKVVDYLADGFEAVARFNGGSNAGHTIVIGGTSYKLHLVPSGALRGKRLLIGAGVAVDTEVLSQELGALEHEGHKVNLLLDSRCTLVSPLEKAFDSLLEEMRGSDPLGTTKMGIGPAYAMRALRLSPRALDLFSRAYDASHAEDFYRRLGIEAAPYLRWLDGARALLEGRLGDVPAEIDGINQGGGGVLFEGAHGSMLDLVFGTYPFVTSSQTVAGGVLPSLGLPPSRLGAVVGVVKSYATRVGAGPFPTEMAGGQAEEIRSVGAEYGVTTGRPRRIGWLDLVALKYAVRLSGVDKLALTKVDVLSSVDELKVCVAYTVGRGESSNFHDFLGELDRARPVYESLPPLKGADIGDPASAPLRRLVGLIEEETGVPVGLVSYGQERGKTLEL